MICGKCRRSKRWKWSVQMVKVSRRLAQTHTIRDFTPALILITLVRKLPQSLFRWSIFAFSMRTIHELFRTVHFYNKRNFFFDHPRGPPMHFPQRSTFKRLWLFNPILDSPLSKTLHFMSFWTVYFNPGLSVLTQTVHSYLDPNSLNQFPKRKKPYQGISMAKSEEYSSYATNLFFKDSESDRAKRFQDRNSILIYVNLLLKNII